MLLILCFSIKIYENYMSSFNNNHKAIVMIEHDEQEKTVYT